MFLMFEELAVSTKTVLSGDGIFKRSCFDWHQSQGHIGTEEDETANTRKIGSPIRDGSLINDCRKGELSKNNGNKKNNNVYGEEGLFTNARVRVEN